jgi:phospholipid/cholesterol/gamma-HCH transport system ATP-binding protein
MIKNTLSFSKVDKSFGAKIVLKNFNLTVGHRESFALMGQSGTGKSVALKCLLGLVRHDAGVIMRGEYTVNRKAEGAQSERMDEIGVVFQGAALFDSMTVGHNILFALDPFLRTSNPAHKKRVLETLKHVGLTPDVYDLMPSEISGGMAKRVAIARAIIQKPKFLFLDEPTTGLDPLSGLRIAELIRSIHTRENVTTFTITHDLNLAHTIADRIGVLDGGKLVWNGSFEAMKKTKLPLIKKVLAAQKLF